MEWQETFDTLRDSVCVLDADGRILRCNQATVTLTQRELADVIGRPCAEVFRAAHPAAGACPAEQAQRERSTVETVVRSGKRWLSVSYRPRYDGAGELTGAVHVVRDITALRAAERDLRASVRRLRDLNDKTMLALAKIVEMRDPYTAGHQRRVGELATRIGRRLGLDNDAITGLGVAGMLHDLGKVTVPAEILTKPTRLSPVELQLVMGHPEAGFLILRDIDLPHDVAEATRQHHERLDGSGYPRGLRDGEIILAARVLAVADVVEAMASHRPYRPALGIEAALAEISEHRGRLYDPAVVAACLDVFAQGFRFGHPGHPGQAGS